MLELIANRILVHGTLLAGLLWCGPAVAETPPTVALIVLPDEGTDPALVREVRKAIVGAFSAEAGVQLIDPLKRPALSGETSARYAPLLERGRQELEAQRYRQASQDLARAVAAIRTDLSQTPKAVLAEAMLELAAALCGAGRQPLALRTLMALLVWRAQLPALRGDPPAGWDRLVEQAHGALRSMARGSVLVTTIPPRAEAFVDGRRLGPTPVLARDLLEGTHILSLRLEGYERTVIPLEVRPGQRTLLVGLTWSVQTEALRLAALRPSLGEARLKQAEGLRRALGVDRGLFVLVTGGSVNLQLSALYYDLQSGRRIAHASLDTRAPLRAAELGPLALWRAVPVQRQAEMRQSWYRKWWVWTIAGVVVAASVGIPVALRARSSTSNESVQLRW